MSALDPQDAARLRQIVAELNATVPGGGIEAVAADCDPRPDIEVRITRRRIGAEARLGLQESTTTFALAESAFASRALFLTTVATTLRRLAAQLEAYFKDPFARRGGSETPGPRRAPDSHNDAPRFTTRVEVRGWPTSGFAPPNAPSADGYVDCTPLFVVRAEGDRESLRESRSWAESTDEDWAPRDFLSVEDAV